MEFVILSTDLGPGARTSSRAWFHTSIKGSVESDPLVSSESLFAGRQRSGRCGWAPNCWSTHHRYHGSASRIGSRTVWTATTAVRVVVERTREPISRLSSTDKPFHSISYLGLRMKARLTEGRITRHFEGRMAVANRRKQALLQQFWPSTGFVICVCTGDCSDIYNGPAKLERVGNEAEASWAPSSVKTFMLCSQAPQCRGRCFPAAHLLAAQPSRRSTK